MKIKVDVWNMVNGKDYHMIVNLTKDDIERIAMEKQEVSLIMMQKSHKKLDRSIQNYNKV